MTEPLFISSSPVFEVDGQLRGELARDIVRLDIEEATDGLKTLRARFVAYGPMAGMDEAELLHVDGSALDFGKTLDVAIGPAENQRTIFHGFVSALEADFQEEREPHVVVFGEDKLMSLRMTRGMRTFENMSDGDIAEEIATKHGLATDIDIDGPTYDVVQQWNMSDLAFLRERARLIQAEVWIQDDTLCVKSRQKRSATDVTLVRGNQVLSLQVRADLAHQRTCVHVSGVDVDDRAVIDEVADGQTIRSEVAGGRTGPEILQRAFGQRVTHRVCEVPRNAQEAGDWGRAEMLRRSRAFVSASGVTSGTPDMVVGTRLTLERVGAPFEGDGYYVTRVCHTYDLSEGHRTHFDAERPFIREAT